MNDCYPVLVESDTLIAFAPIKTRVLRGEVWCVTQTEIKMVVVDYRFLDSLEDPVYGARAKLRICDRLREARSTVYLNNHRIRQVDESFSFLNKEFKFKGPVLSLPLCVEDFFIGYKTRSRFTDELILVRWAGRYDIALDFPNQVWHSCTDSCIEMRQKNEKMKLIKKDMEDKKYKMIEENKKLEHNILCWEHNLEIIQKRNYVSLFEKMNWAHRKKMNLNEEELGLKNKAGFS